MHAESRYGDGSPPGIPAHPGLHHARVHTLEEDLKWACIEHREGDEAATDRIERLIDELSGAREVRDHQLAAVPAVAASDIAETERLLDAAQQQLQDLPSPRNRARLAEFLEPDEVETAIAKGVESMTARVALVEARLTQPSLPAGQHS